MLNPFLGIAYWSVKIRTIQINESISSTQHYELYWVLLLQKPPEHWDLKDTFSSMLFGALFTDVLQDSDLDSFRNSPALCHLFWELFEVYFGSWSSWKSHLNFQAWMKRIPWRLQGQRSTDLSRIRPSPETEVGSLKWSRSQFRRLWSQTFLSKTT